MYNNTHDQTPISSAFWVQKDFGLKKFWVPNTSSSKKILVQNSVSTKIIPKKNVCQKNVGSQKY